MVYRHLKTNKPYLRLLRSKVKINNIWTPCVVYMCLYLNKDGMVWVRLEDDFNKNFR